MPWVRIDDQFPEHPKVTEAGHLAGWLAVCGLAYSNRLLTDGFIADAMVPRLSSVPAPAKRAAELVAAGIWLKVDGGFQIHEYLKYQKSGAQIRKERQQAADRQARFRSGRGGSNGVTDGHVAPSPLPHPPNTVGLLLTSVPEAERDEPLIAAPLDPAARRALVAQIKADRGKSSPASEASA